MGNREDAVSLRNDGGSEFLQGDVEIGCVCLENPTKHIKSLNVRQATPGRPLAP